MLVKVLGFVLLGILLLYLAFSCADLIIKVRRKKAQRRAEQNAIDNESPVADTNGADGHGETDVNN